MSFEIPQGLMVSVSGVRGRVGEDLTPEVVVRFASAFGAWLRESTGEDRPRVILGRDSRTSGALFARAAAAGLESTGCDVIEVGIAPTPTTLFAIRHHRAQGAIVVTASHNPVEWNALKFASAAGMFLDSEEAPRMRAFVSERPIPRSGWDTIGQLSRDDGAVERHLEAVLSLPFLDIEGLRARRFRVALDCVRGAGGVLLPALLERLGCDVVGLNLVPDGRFPRPPEPVVANLSDLETSVTSAEADLGMATDPDADRLSLVGPGGRAVGEDYTLALSSMLVLRHRSGPVVTNLSTSRLLDDVAERAGVSLARAPVGEIHVARRMERDGAVIGGEGNGGVILPDVHHTRDAAVAAALVLQLLLETGRDLDELVAELPSYAIVKDKLPRGGGTLEPTYRALEEGLGALRADRQDGLRLDWPEARRWLHLRPSGTEPILRIIAEAPEEEEALALVERARQALAKGAGTAAGR